MCRCADNQGVCASAHYMKMLRSVRRVRGNEVPRFYASSESLKDLVENLLNSYILLLHRVLSHLNRFMDGLEYSSGLQHGLDNFFCNHFSKV